MDYNKTQFDENLPVFTPPPSPFSGRSCYHHSNQPAVATCARCGKYICEDCAEAYGVSIGEYKDRHICYDCCVDLVAENVEILGKNRKKIILELIFSPYIFIFRCFWGIFKGMLELVSGDFAEGIGIMIGYGIRFYVELFQGIKYLINTFKAEKSDKEALQRIKDYMQYTLIRNKNSGMDLDTLMMQQGELADNSYARMVREKGEASAESTIRGYVATINENGEIIRSYVA